MWYSAGRSAKLSQVDQLLRGFGYEITWLNTSPVPSRERNRRVLQISAKYSSLRRLSDFIFGSKNIFHSITPDLVWVYNSRVPEAVVVGRLSKRQANIKVIVELEDLPAARKENSSWRGRLDRVSTQWLLNRASFVTCLSQSFAEALTSLVRVGPEKIKFFPPLLDEAYLSTVCDRSFAPCSRRRIRIMYAGGYSAEKGVDDLLWAFSKLPVSLYSLHLFGPVPANIVAWARSNPFVYIHGVIAKDRLYQGYRNADVVVNPHRPIQNSDFIFPFKIVEQLASGAIPLLSSHFAMADLGVPPGLTFSGKHELYERLANVGHVFESLDSNLAELVQRFRKQYDFNAVKLTLKDIFVPAEGPIRLESASCFDSTKLS